MILDGSHFKEAAELLKHKHVKTVKGVAHFASKSSPIIPVPNPELPSTQPQPIGESDKKKQCPAGFEFLGKQCAKTLSAEPDVVCPPGTTIADDRCVKYIGKYAECPPGYSLSAGSCVKKSHAPPETVCPEGFILGGKDACVRKIQLEDRKECPPGSIVKGDICVISSTAPPDYVCPTGYNLIGSKCQREEVFDCTPARQNTHSKEPEQHSKGEKPRINDKFQRHQNGHGKNDVTRYTLQEAAPQVEEYIIQKICKRVTTEPARRICPEQGYLDGKVCRIEKQLDHIMKKGGFRDEFVPLLYKCPLGYAETNDRSICEAVEEVYPSMLCPANTVDQGQRCALFSMSRRDCPQGFSLEGKECRKTIFAAPIVEYTVTYTCTGKNCGDRHHE